MKSYLKNLKDDEVLFFIRIRGKKSYFKNVYKKNFLSLFKSIKKFRCISEYKKDADVHIDINSIKRDWLFKEEIRVFDRIINLNEVIARCRGLRNISYIEAKSLVIKTYIFFNNLYLNEKKLKIIITGAVDNYVMDIMQRVGAYKKINFLGVANSFISQNYKLITVRGELNNFSKKF